LLSFFASIFAFVWHDLFEPKIVNFTARRLDELLRENVLAKRPNVKGQVAWGPKIKMGIHVASGIPVALFMTTAEAWWNYLVCRTGPKASNERIAAVGQARGWKWKPYTPGLCKLDDGNETGEFHKVTSEKEVFEFVGMPYQEPWDRN
jgi:DNA polymerase/3'-5' exonuclease PolX